MNKPAPDTSDIIIFDRTKVRMQRNRSAKNLKQHGFLVDWAMEQIIDRLGDVKKTLPTALQLGLRSDIALPESTGVENLYKLDLAEKLLTTDSSKQVQADEEFLPFANDSFDLIISPLNLHTTNDLPGTLIQIKNALKPDGLFIAAMLGGETLYELRKIMSDAEMKILEGLSPRVAPFADMQQMGALMQRANFKLPVVDSEKIIVTYDNVFKLMQDLRLMGENNALMERYKKTSTKKFMQEVGLQYQEQLGDENGAIPATFEVIFLIGWKDHESQQKPLRPGSAQNRLADALKTKEEKL